MNKKVIVLSSLLALISLSSCQPSVVTKEFSTSYNLSFNEGNVQYQLNNECTDVFNVYSKEKSLDSLELETQINNGLFETDNIYKYYQFVPVINGKEIEEGQTPLINYVEGAFSSSNVKVFSKRNSDEEIQRYIDYQYSSLRGEEFSSSRCAMLFLPGKYENVTLQLGYYTTINGLGESPLDVEFYKLEVNNHPNTGNALINFWRTAENFTVNNNSLWAVSQATSLRRTYFKGELTLSDYTPNGNNYSSGGFIGDSVIDSKINPGSQQQWFMRNSTFSSWPYASMNMVFLGSKGNVPQGDFYQNKTTFINKTPLIREKPYLVFDEEKGYGVKVPSLKYDSEGVSWQNQENSEFIPLDEFYVAHSQKDDYLSLNNALNEGKHLLLTPGIYQLDKPLQVNNPDTIIYGLGMATLAITDNNQDSLLKVSDVEGVKINGILLQAGKQSKSLLEIGDENSDSHEDNPISLADVFFRVGGNTVENTSCEVCALINSNNVIGDNFWVWRADHGLRLSNDNRYGIGWDKNYGKNGLIVNGDNVTIYGLMVEHFEEYQTIWNGENGLMVFYQSETPYDALKQSDWMKNKDSAKEEDQGFASYKIGENVTSHEAYGLGVYFVNSIDVTKYLDHAIEAPSNERIYLEHMVTRHFGGKGYIRNVINNIQGTMDSNHNSALKKFSGGKYE